MKKERFEALTAAQDEQVLNAWSKRQKAKYKNRKVTIDGITFDSIAEGNRWSELQLLLKAGKIMALEHHKRIAVEGIPVHIESGPVTICKYEADFIYVDTTTGSTVIEDVKGFRTKEYLLKRKMLKLLCGVEIREITRGPRKRRRRWQNRRKPPRP